MEDQEYEYYEDDLDRVIDTLIEEYEDNQEPQEPQDQEQCN